MNKNSRLMTGYIILLFAVLGFLEDDGNDTLMMPHPSPRKKPKKQSKTTAAKGRTRIVKTMDSSSEDETDTSRLNKTGWISSQVNRNENKGTSKNRIKSSSTSASDESHLFQKPVKITSRLKSSTSSTGPDADSPVVTGLTQMAPLRDRVRQRLELKARTRHEKKKEEPAGNGSPFTRLKPTGNNKIQEKDLTTGKHYLKSESFL